MKDWTADDSEALFRQPSDKQPKEARSSEFDGSAEAMRRLRFPFEANGSGTPEQPATPADEDGNRR